MTTVSRSAANSWPFVKFGLLVTGKGEERFVPGLFRALAKDGRCHFEVIRRIEQVRPLSSPRRIAKMAGSGKAIPSKDDLRIGRPARDFLQKGDNRRVVVIDDLEHDWRAKAPAVFGRYREALDGMLGPAKSKASVQFFVNMVEAYFLADPLAVKEVLGCNACEQNADVESIRHPKGVLAKAHPGYREVDDGKSIAARVDMEKVLSNPATCKALRTLFLWCVQHAGMKVTDRFRLRDGAVWNVTAGQLPSPVAPERIQKLSQEN